ncbi:hypothetical protein SK803_12590 [Lentzea sp. BCCO 10_0856]|uniref:Guanylate cyclase domain-containing protein n=1 Tax=Lentzea miocenica TaxID=3095431 RepID=A0ABU4SYT4_9PSEU|nr:hypothetical protein [Lentzea sp. BCCO 10_0856]MDX8031057.1 hypothetical protein [Lentzea sp. BCCO 10_0856]
MSEPVTRTFLVVDMEKSSSRENEELPVLRRQLYTMLHEGITAAGLLGGLTVTEDRGDGVLVIADASVIAVLSKLTQKLVDELSRYNATVDPPAWLRLRIAIHSGLVHRDPRGWSSEELTKTFRICDLPEAKETLSAAHRAQAIVIVSDHVFGTVVKHGYSKLPKDSFGEIKDGVAWAWVPGYLSPPVPAAVPQAVAETEPLSRKRDVTNSVSGTVTGNVVQAGEIGQVDARNYFRGPR